MKVLGLTRSGKAICNTSKLTVLERLELYKNFDQDDHYDAACIWTVYSYLDYAYFGNKEFHQVLAGLSDVRSEEAMILHAKGLVIHDRMYTFNGTGS